VGPLQEQIQHFQSEFERLNLQVSELTSTKAKLSDEVEQLKVRAHSAEDRLEKMSNEFGEFVRVASAREQYVWESPL
jgi:prefoldin subunit 5